MNRPVPLSGFTLLEVLVSLTIFSLLLGLGFSGLGAIERIYRDITNKRSERWEQRSFERCLRQDLARCRFVRQLGEQLELMSLDDTTRFRFAGNVVYRSRQTTGRQFTDTFRLEVKMIHRGLGDRFVHEGLVDRFHLLIGQEETAAILCFQKVYSATDLITWETD